MFFCKYDHGLYFAELKPTVKNGTLSIHYGSNNFEDIAESKSQQRLKMIDEVPLPELMKAKGSLREKGILFKLEVRC